MLFLGAGSIENRVDGPPPPNRGFFRTGLSVSRSSSKSFTFGASITNFFDFAGLEVAMLAGGSFKELEVLLDGAVGPEGVVDEV